MPGFEYEILRSPCTFVAEEDAQDFYAFKSGMSYGDGLEYDELTHCILPLELGSNPNPVNKTILCINYMRYRCRQPVRYVGDKCDACNRARRGHVDELLSDHAGFLMPSSFGSRPNPNPQVIYCKHYSICGQTVKVAGTICEKCIAAKRTAFPYPDDDASCRMDDF